MAQVKREHARVVDEFVSIPSPAPLAIEIYARLEAWSEAHAYCFSGVVIAVHCSDVLVML